MNHKGKLLILIAMLGCLSGAQVVSAQSEPQQQQTTPPPMQQQDGDPIRQLNLTPEQREQIRAIREDKKKERAEIALRVREANRALEEALDSDTPDEAVVEQRMRDLGAAQAAAMRMRILTEVRIRKVLTREQLVILRGLRLQARRTDRQRMRDERQQQRRQILNGAPALQNQRNNVGPLIRPRDLKRRQRP
jgi:Spy/CpxP family protein refolding chaperone